MEIPILITSIDVRQYKDISDSIFEETFNQFVKEAQFMDIEPLIGNEMYNDLLNNPDNVVNNELLEGGMYTYSGKTYTNVGLKVILIHYAYARYVKFGSYTDTAFSFVQKLNPESEPVSDKQKQVIFKQNQQIAFKYWANVRDFLDRNTEDYPLWNTECNNTNSTFRISKIV